MSRSALYAEALALLLSTRNDDVTERLDAVYADESSSIDPTVERANVGLAAEPW